MVTAFTSKAPTPFGTTLAGSTAIGGKIEKTHFEVKITASQLKAAVERDNHSVSGKPKGCNRGLPEEPANLAEYRLVGIEDGIEGGGHTQLGFTTSHLRAWTEYTPLPPSVTTGTASEASETEATLTGTVNPNGSDTHYDFEYGETTGYGKATHEADAGAGATELLAAASTGGLLPETTYHYRIVARNAAGTSDGSDRTCKSQVSLLASVRGSGFDGNAAHSLGSCGYWEGDRDGGSN